MQTSLSLAMDVDLRLHTPLMYQTKAETWKLAKDLGTVAGCDVFETVRVMSHTDYNGDRSQLNEWGYGKLDNPASKLRAEGFQKAKENGWI
jgi:7-cyano-7-deazaguanine synthase